MGTSTGTKSYRIAIDCMGGDKGPGEIISAVAKVLDGIGTDDKLVLIGQETVLHPLLKKAKIENHPRIEIKNATDIVEMDDKPLQALKSKKDSSMMVALEMVKAGDADTMVTTGNTKVLVGASTIKLRPMPGADRPVLAAIMPNRKGYFILMDVGANPETTPEQLVHNAVFGSLYAQSILSVAKPRVGLLTVGTEEGKGGERINATHAMLKKLDGIIDYIGPVEGFDMFHSKVDVVVTDGFTGNVLLKSLEGLFYMLLDLVKEKAGYNPIYFIGAILLSPFLLKLKHHLKPERTGGAPLLGLNNLIIKAHGSSRRNAIVNAILLAREALSHDLDNKMRDAIALTNTRITESPTEAN